MLIKFSVMEHILIDKTHIPYLKYYYSWVLHLSNFIDQGVSNPVVTQREELPLLHPVE